MNGVFWWGLIVGLGIVLGSLLMFSSYPRVAADRPPLPFVLKDKAPLTIVFMGTSLTAASGGWPALVAQSLEACRPNSVQALRIARGGATSAWGVSQLETVIALAPDLVVLEFAINDADLRRGISLTASEANHRAIVTRLKLRLPEVPIILMTTNPAIGLRRLLRPRLPAYYALYHKLSLETGAGLIDLTPRWLTSPTLAQDLTDGIHPSPAAAASVVVPVVTAYLARLFGMDCGL